MNNNNTTYRPLGDYIRPVDVRNRDLKVTTLVGLSVSKEFMPSIANTIGTDMSTYKIVDTNQFVYIADTSRRGDKIAIALWTQQEKAIVSSIYTVFEIVDREKLLPEYLMMWFRRPEFDRYARYHSHGSAREIFDWAEMCATMVPVPPIVEQRAVVAEYEAVARRIAVAKRTIATLQDTAKTLYRKMFVDGIDKENLPEGWRWGTIKDYCQKMTSGGTPNRGCDEYWNSNDHSWLKSGEVQNNVIINIEEYISTKGLENSSAKLIPAGTVVMAMYGATAAQVGYLTCETTTNQACCNMICKSNLDSAFLFFHLLFSQEDIKRLANGGAQENLSQELIANQPILLFDDNNCKQPFATILDNLVVSYKEIEKLTEIQTIILSGMGR
ncbi:MAG: restriction endonuclease subunit S [Bacteroidales bacterium]|nr:restriction endonuclease subunit S [Bacteroidales bacterium]